MHTVSNKQNWGETMYIFDLESAKSLFLTNRKSRNLSKQTLFWYDLYLTKFIQHIGNRELASLKGYDIEQYLTFRQEQPNTRDVTVRDIYKVLKVFFNFLLEEEYILHNPMKRIKPPKIHQKIMRTFSKQEIQKILDSFDKNEFFGLRDYLIMCCFFSTGMRKAELLGLKLSDINITTDMIKVNGKGSRDRLVPVGRTLRRIILQYLARREEYLVDCYCDYFIVSQRKTRLSHHGMNCLFQRIKKNLGASGERFSPHTWRHTFAKNFLLNGGDVFSLQKILGHSDIVTTKKYIALNDREMKLQHSKFNPLDNAEWSIF